MRITRAGHRWGGPVTVLYRDNHSDEGEAAAGDLVAVLLFALLVDVGGLRKIEETEFRLAFNTGINQHAKWLK